MKSIPLIYIFSPKIQPLPRSSPMGTSLNKLGSLCAAKCDRRGEEVVDDSWVGMCDCAGEGRAICSGMLLLLLA